MNRGDTGYLILNYTINGSPLEQNAYQEIELQLNKQGAYPYSIKKLLSDGSIMWGTLSYDNEGTESQFTGYYCTLSQRETFDLQSGEIAVQLRVLVDDEVGSSAITSITLGQVLSSEVLHDPD